MLGFQSGYTNGTGGERMRIFDMEQIREEANDAIIFDDD